MMKFKVSGLVADLMPNIRLIQASGHFMLNYHADNSGALHTLRLGYCCLHLVFVLFQYGCTFVNLVKERDDVNDLAANTITVLFFTHCVTKFVYFALRSKLFYRTLGIWNQANSHPLFIESNNRYHALALKKMRRLLYIVVSATLISSIAWSVITFVGDSVHNIKDPDNENETITEEIPRLLVRSWYPWNAMSGMAHYGSLGFQIYYVLFSLAHANLLDSLFCSWLIFACEQLQHLKEIMKPLMELSATLDTYVPKSADLFRAPSVTSQDNLIDNDYNNAKNEDLNLKGVYSTRQELGGHYRTGALQNFAGGVGPNGLSKKQELMVRSAIKYWVERHKHVVRLVTAIGDAYGVALLLHMLTSTIMLTLLAYQATKINGVDKYAATVLGYLIYALAQVFHFCIFGNRLIEESSSVMEAAYSCHWYDGSEEAKTFVQIVCQQCQKAMSISGAKFFTISLDLFASVLGAVVTYFMVLVQLKKIPKRQSEIRLPRAPKVHPVHHHNETSQQELDLDFLERRQNETATSNANNATSEGREIGKSPIELSPESVDRVKVILLGAPAVGKTSIIQQFVWNDFCEDYIATDRKHTYYPSVITNDHLYEIKISDLPVIPYFPVNSYYEWANYRYYGLRSATAYVLVFDLSNIETFQYIRTLREQICESRNMSNVPLLVVGNKQDLISDESATATSGSTKAIAGGIEEKRRDIVNLVRKHWKCGYIECSAKYNWKVVAVFKELITMIDSLESRDQSPMLDNIQDALDRNKCVVI